MNRYGSSLYFFALKTVSGRFSDIYYFFEVCAYKADALNIISGGTAYAKTQLFFQGGFIMSYFIAGFLISFGVIALTDKVISSG